MNGFVGIRDKDYKVTLLKQDWHQAQGLRCKATKSNWENKDI